MISLNTVTISTTKGERTIYVSVAMLDSESLANLKPGKIRNLFLYDNLRDENYNTNAPLELLTRMPDSKDLVINYGQEFQNYFLGELDMDFDEKHYSNWRGNSDKFTTEDLKLLMQQLFNTECELDTVIIFTPTKPSDINISLRKS